MADLKITQLDAVVTPADADLLEVVQDVATTPVNRKITWTQIKAFLKTYFDSLYDAIGAASAVAGDLSSHEGDTANPHAVTKTQVGLSNVTNVAQVELSGNQTVAGIKTFSSSPIVPDPTTDQQVASKKYVDDNAGGTPGLIRVGGDATERTTTSTSPVDLVTISGLSIPAGTRVRVTGKYRKSTGAAVETALGLKINSTVVSEADYTQNGIGATTSTDEAQRGSFEFEFEVGEANYDMTFIGSWVTFRPDRTVITSGIGSYPRPKTAVIPSATITSIIIRGVSNSGSVTLAVKNVQVYIYANS